MLTVPVTDPPVPATWQSQLADLVTDPVELCTLLSLDPASLDLAQEAINDFPLRVPRPFLARMQKGNPRDPLLLQVLPKAAELLEVEGYSDDPLGEASSNPAPGLLHKYRGRLLLLPTAACAIHCRYCFRRHFPYADNVPARSAWERSLDYLREDETLTEVILSGGDPLTLSDRHLDWLLTRLEAIPHLERLRIHTRLPIMIPSRVDAMLCNRLQRSRLRAVVVLHSNHGNEIDAEVAEACRRLRDAGVTLLNQSVLLKGINDDLASLQTLCETLFRAGVLPYYLHLPDRTRGTAHFDVSEDRARALHRELQARMPGYLVPKLVRETAGESGKTLM